MQKYPAKAKSKRIMRFMPYSGVLYNWVYNRLEKAICSTFGHFLHHFSFLAHSGAIHIILTGFNENKLFSMNFCDIFEVYHCKSIVCFYSIESKNQNCIIEFTYICFTVQNKNAYLPSLCTWTPTLEMKPR